MNPMKQWLATMAVIFLLAAAAAAAAGAEDQPVSGETIKQQTYELLGSLKDYTLQQKDDLMEALEQGMDDLDERIDLLQERIDGHWESMSESARDQADATLSALRRQRIRLQEAYQRLLDGSGPAWEQLKEGFGQAYEDVNHSWEKAMQEYAD
ncbi:MAG: hypothetical protein ABW076_12825 [Candidatus Thiodiazotropha sp.]